MDILLFVHVLGAIIFLGNVITAAFWKIRADVTGNPAIIHITAKNVMLADFVFTLPGLVLIIVSGSLMAATGEQALSGFNWLTLSLNMFAITGIIWGAVLIPVQLAMIRHSASSIESGVISKAYRKASMYWAVFGIIASLLPVAILYLMITKPL